MVNQRTIQMIVKQDHELESEAGKANDSLARHRWHWTLDESNPDRFESIREYARLVGRNEATIRTMANACVDHLRTGRDIQTAVQLQTVKESDRQITEAVARATKTSVVTTRQHHKDDVDKVRTVVADAREAEPDMGPEREQQVIDRSAGLIAAERKARKASDQQRRKSKPLQVLVVEGDLASARTALEKALKDARSLDLAEIEEELADSLRAMIDRVIAIGQLVQLALGRGVDVDWDAELEKIGG
jgi:hypothetical protein